MPIMADQRPSLLDLSRPKVAIVIPVFRHSVLLCEAIESGLIQQAEFPIQIVIVNDGCPHLETEAVCIDYAISYPEQVTYLRKSNGGLSSARNHGILFALQRWPKLEAVYLLDADNRLSRRSIAKAMALMHASDCDWVYPNIDMFGLKWAGDFGGSYSKLVHVAMNVCEAGSLIRRRVFDSGVLFDEDMRLGFEDWDFFLSAGSKGFTGNNLDDFGFRYRKRPESMLADSNRDEGEIKSGLMRKHKHLSNPKNLLRLEQREAPRYAFYLADEHKYVLTVDPSQTGTELTEAEFDRRLWASRTSPSRNHIPPFLVVTSRLSLSALRDMHLLHWSLWRLEDGLRSHPVATLSYKITDGVRFGVEENVAQSGRHLDAALLMIAPGCLEDVLRDAHSTWIDSLLLPNCEPPVFNVSVTYPSYAASVVKAPRSAIVHTFLTQIHNFRRSPYKFSADSRWDWREAGIPIRKTSHEIVRQRFNGAPAMPKLNMDGRQIGFLLPLAEFGGVEKVTHSMAAAFRSRGWTTHLIVLSRREAMVSVENLEIYETVSFLCDDSLDDYANAPSFQGTLLSNWSHSDKRGRAIGLLHWLDVVVNCHGAAISGLMGQLRRIGIKTVASLHLSDLTPLGRPVGNTYVALAHEHAYDIFATCSYRLASWCHGMGVPQDKVVPVPNAGGYEAAPEVVDRILKSRTSRQDDRKPLRVLFLGRLVRQKGLDRLAAVLRICKEESVPVEWRLIGKAVVEADGGHLLAKLQTAVEPPVQSPDELNDVYEWADILVLLSYFEGLPLTILEAMRLGVVVVATDVGAVSEVVIDGKTGVLLRSESVVGECVQALSTFARSPRMLKDFSRAAAAQMKGHSWSAAISQLADRLEKAIPKLPVTESSTGSLLQ